jgi:hypothetical protein
MVFAAKGVANAAADGGFQWVAVGRGTAGQTNVLNTSGNNGFGPCAESQANEDACSLNVIPGNDAENPRVAAGTLTPGQPTVPWVVWEEANTSGRHGIFVARLVGGDHFELVNGGQPISNPHRDSSQPDITFAGNTPYVSWQEQVDDGLVTFVGHFESAVLFRLDTPDGIDGSAFLDVDNPQRAPISSTCTANPFNADGAACQGNAIGTPFFLFTSDRAGEKKLFADAFAPSNVHTLPIPGNDVTSSSVTLRGLANPGGTKARVHFDFGATTAYGSTTTPELLGVSVVPTMFDALLSGLSPGSTLHYRAVAASDFASVVGADATVAIVNHPPVVNVHVPADVRLRDLGHPPVLPVGFDVDEAATVTVGLRKNDKWIRRTTVSQPSAGASGAMLSLRRVHPGRYALQVVGTDSEGDTSGPVTLPLHIRH